MEIINKFYLIDFIFIALGLKILYTAVSRGVINEIFKTAGLLCGSFLAFHYYSYFTARAGTQFPFLNKKYLAFICFLIIFLSISTGFFLARRIAAVLFKREEIYGKERWFSFFVGWFRFVYLASVILFSLNLYSFEQEYFCKSFSYRLFKNVAPKIYLMSFEVIDFCKLSSCGQGNKEVKDYYEIRKCVSGSDQKRD